MLYEDEKERLERLEKVRKAWQPLYDEQNYTLTLDDAREISESIQGLVEFLKREKDKESEEEI